MEELKTILLQILGQIKEVAYEQATREYSGANWAEDFFKRTDKIEIQIQELPSNK